MGFKGAVATDWQAAEEPGVGGPIGAINAGVDVLMEPTAWQGITTQLAKNLYVKPSKNPLRKVKENIIARQLEQALSKQRIFEIYLNVVEWGRNVYGAEAAARFYFGKAAAALDPLEAATLAALVPSPRTSKERNILSRRNLILGRLASVGYISGEEYQRAKQAPLFQKVEETAPELPAEE
jgi:monofunctional biosynthetic peptidoglycan transglycosylase